MSKFVEQIRNTSVKNNKQSKEIDSKVLKDKQDIMKRIKFVTNKYYDDILDGINKAADKGYTKYYINLCPDDFIIPDVEYEANKLKRRWLSMLLSENSELVPEDKPSLNGFTFKVWNNEKNTVVFEW